MHRATVSRPTAFGARPVRPAARSRVHVAARCQLKVYTNPGSRGRFIEWYLKEIGTPAEHVNLEMREKREHKSPEFLQVNPFGKVPALSDDGLNVFESGAMLLYLADKYGPAKTPEARAKAAQWVLFANSTLANSVFVEQFRERAFPDVFGSLDKVLADRQWLEGEFTVADVAVGAYLSYIPAFFPQMDLSPYPNVQAYMQRVAARPAFHETLGARLVEMEAARAAKEAAEKEEAKS